MTTLSTHLCNWSISIFPIAYFILRTSVCITPSHAEIGLTPGIGVSNAQRLLDKYRDKHAVFNDDV